jgi:hypothetical protein
MITQQEFIADCYLGYAAKGLEPGNPLYGEWQKCHYPTPASLGGTAWVWLLEEHHAIQGILQCEEFQHPCIFGWERKFLRDDMMPLFSKWMTIKSQRAAAAGHTEYGNRKRAEWNKNVLSKLISGEDNYAWGWDWYHNSAGQNKRFPVNPGGDWLPGMKKKGYTNTLYQCTVTGYISNAGGLSHYQKKRGIDTSNRIRLE